MVNIDVFTEIINVLRSPSVSLLRVLLATVLSDGPYDFATQAPRQLGASYDFVVVGAGAAGSILAARLAETGASVVLLEAGRDAPPESSVPGFMPLQLGGDLDWSFRVAPQKYGQFGYINNGSIISQGKVIGGGSTIGGMVYARGSKHDFDNWAALGNPGWDYNSVLPYFKKLEDNDVRDAPFQEEFHGKSGPMRVSSKTKMSEVGRSFLEAGRELGYKIVDENVGGGVGFSPLHFTIRDGVRDTVAERYLRPLMESRRNLVVKPNTFVTKIIFKGTNATGVQYIYNKKVFKVSASKEVLVCAGAINSPKLLMLSGIGPPTHLHDIKIPVLVPLEGVGSNLKDHHAVLNFPFAAREGSAFSLSQYLNAGNVKNYLRDRSGKFSEQFGEDGAAWMHLSSEGDSNWPDVQFTLLNLALSNFGYFAALYNSALRKEVYEDVLGPLEGGTSFVLAPMLSRPKSSGTVRLRSREPLDAPIIDSNFLEDPDDLALLVQGVRVALEITHTKAMKDGVSAEFKSKRLRQCQHLPDSDKYWECFVRHLVTSLWHLAGTCKMAPSTDPMSVVDNELKVRGVSRLRIVDASIMPQVVSSNTMAATFMIAEKAADLIKQDWY